MMRAFAGWRALRRGDQLRALEAAAWLSLAWIVVRLLPFRAYSRVLGRPTAAANAETSSTPAEARGARDVGLAVRRVSRNLPWQSTCLMQVVAASIMLRLRRCHPRAFVGAARRDGQPFEFHAWLIAGGVPVCGVHEASRYTIVATFH